jgi:hypothetical protein
LNHGSLQEAKASQKSRPQSSAERHVREIYRQSRRQKNCLLLGSMRKEDGELSR